MRKITPGRDPGLLAAVAVVGPFLGQEQPPVHEGVALGRAVVGEDGDLAVVGPAQGAGVLALDADGLGPLLGEAGLVGVPDGVVVGQHLQHAAAHLVEDLGVGPGAGGEEGLEGADGPAAHGLGDVLGVAPLAAVEQPLDEAAGVGLVLVAAEEGGEAVEEAIELRLEGQQLRLVHDRSPRDG